MLWYSVTNMGDILSTSSLFVRFTLNPTPTLRHCATNRKVADSIPDCIIGIFHWHNPSRRTMTLGLTQPLTEMTARNISWGEGGLRWPVRRADNLTTFMCRLSWNLGASASWNPQGLSRPVMGLLYLYRHLHNSCRYHRDVRSRSGFNVPSTSAWTLAAMIGQYMQNCAI